MYSRGRTIYPEIYEKDTFTTVHEPHSTFTPLSTPFRGAQSNVTKLTDIGMEKKCYFSFCQK